MEVGLIFGIATSTLVVHMLKMLILSHWHWDHIGSPATFPPTTDLIVGRGFKEAMLPGAPANPSSPILESDYAYVCVQL